MYARTILVNPIATRATALGWIGIWKLLDVASTVGAKAYAPIPAREINVFINAAATHVGFVPALLGTVPLALGMVYALYHRFPTAVEFFAVILPLVVVSNTLLAVHPAAHVVMFLLTGGVAVGYFVYSQYRHYQRVETLTQFFVSIPGPCLWTPATRGDTA